MNIYTQEVKRFYFGPVIGLDGGTDAADLTGYTIVPYIYNLDDGDVYLSGSAAGSVVKSSTATGQFYWQTLSTTFPVIGDYYIGFQFSSGSLNPKLPLVGNEITLEVN